jgi:hypothetical protein
MRFNQRVLEEAQDETNPLLERVKFLAITASNLDEFVEIRVAGFLQRIEDGYNLAQPPDEGGLTPQERLDGLMERIHRFVEAQYKCWNEQLLPGMHGEKIRVLRWNELSDEARAQALEFYDTEVDPLLTPVTIDPSHPFPRVLNKALCIGLLLRHKRRGLKTAASLGVVTVPRALPRLVPLDRGDDRPAADQLRTRFDTGISHQWPGEPVATDESLLGGEGAATEISGLHREGLQTECEVDRCLRRTAQARCDAASSLRLLQDGGGVYRSGVAGSRRNLDEADAVSDEQRFANFYGSYRGRTEQGSNGRRRVDGAIR